MGADLVLSVWFICPTLVQLIVIYDLRFSFPAKQNILVILLSVCLLEIPLKDTGIIVISIVLLKLIHSGSFIPHQPFGES